MLVAAAALFSIVSRFVEARGIVVRALTRSTMNTEIGRAVVFFSSSPSRRRLSCPRCVQLFCCIFYCLSSQWPVRSLHGSSGRGSLRGTSHFEVYTSVDDEKGIQLAKHYLWVRFSWWKSVTRWRESDRSTALLTACCRDCYAFTNRSVPVNTNRFWIMTCTSKHYRRSKIVGFCTVKCSDKCVYHLHRTVTDFTCSWSIALFEIFFDIAVNCLVLCNFHEVIFLARIVRSVFLIENFFLWCFSFEFSNFDIFLPGVQIILSYRYKSILPVQFFSRRKEKVVKVGIGGTAGVAVVLVEIAASVSVPVAGRSPHPPVWEFNLLPLGTEVFDVFSSV